jgi:hypothetical protein
MTDPESRWNRRDTAPKSERGCQPKGTKTGSPILPVTLMIPLASKVYARSTCELMPFWRCCYAPFARMTPMRDRGTILSTLYSSKFKGWGVNGEESNGRYQTPIE